MWKLFRNFAWLAGASLLPGLLPGVLANFYHSKWTSENGVGAVFDIQQSSDGYLWLTTSRGVLRFDGVRFQSVEEAIYGAVDSNEIDSVYLPPSGGLWLTTSGAGLFYWKDGVLKAFRDRRCTPTRKFGRLVEDRDGSLWVQAAAGLFHLRGSVCEQVGAKQGYPGGFAAGLLLDGDGTLWVKTRAGPLLYLPRGQSKFQRNSYGDGATTSYAYLHRAPDGAIWLSDDQGLRRVTGSPAANKRTSRFGDFTFAPDGSLWAVTPKGVQRFDTLAVDPASGESFTPTQGLSSDAAWKVLIDREGVVWVATNSGLDRLRRTVLGTVALPPAQEREFSVAAGDDGSLWTGNSDLPLTHVSANGAITSFPKTRQTMCVRRDHNGTIWSSGAGDFHLWRSSGKEFSPLHYPGEDLDEAVSIATDRNNDPWITTRSGKAWRFSNGAWISQNQALGKKPGVIGAMTDDQAGNVWFGFSNKVVQWDGSTYHSSSFPQGTRGVSETTMSVRGDRVWLAGSGGIQLFREGHFYLMRCREQGVPGRVSGIVETAAGDLWANGFSGITHVPAAELKKWLHDPGYVVSTEHLDELDGLPGLSGEKVPEPSVVESSEGRLWFATTKGVAWVDPAALEKNRNRLPPSVRISSVTSNGKISAAQNGLTLPAHTDNLEIDYTALSLAIPERVRFRYQLSGVDHGWQNVGTRRQAYYTKLHPGKYRFRVIACNNDGIWNDAGATLDLSLSPAWYQTNWFLALSVACGILLLYAIYRWRVGQISAGINARFDERLAERTRIAQELHDTLLQGFLSASMQVHVAADCLPDGAQAKPILTRALQLMTQVIDEGRNAVRGLRSSKTLSLDLEEAFAAIQQEMDPDNESGTEGQFRVIAEGERRPLHPLLRDEVYRIGREALLNAFRHAHAKQIDVELKYGSNQLRLLVRDNGCGIAPDVLSKGREGHWGLPGMRERAQRIGAKLQVYTSATAGTEVQLVVPGRIAFADQPHRRPFTKAWFAWYNAGPSRPNPDGGPPQP